MKACVETTLSGFLFYSNSSENCNGKNVSVKENIVSNHAFSTLRLLATICSKFKLQTRKFGSMVTKHAFKKRVY